MYRVTAINQLTGEREAISAPHSLARSRRLLKKWQQIAANSQQPAWTKLKVQKIKITEKD